ncbi:MAG: hypothetical protein WD063_06930 [Pirellulales bacterium]
MKHQIAFLLVVSAVVLAGCASIVSKSEYPVAITSNPIGADFVVKRGNGIPVASGITPATITLSASDGYFKPAKYTVEFRRKGVVQSVPLTAKIDGWYFGNILFGGIIGLRIVDPATGAMWSLKDTTMATFQQTADVAPGQRALRIADINSLPMKYRGQLVALN